MDPIEKSAERAAKLKDEDADTVRSLFETIGPRVDRHAKSGGLTAASGIISLLRSVRSFRAGDRKRGLFRVAAGLFWLGVAMTQRRSASSPADVDESDVVGTSVELDDVDGGASDDDHESGEQVVDTTSADIDESETKTELDSDVDQEDVAESDVVGGSDVESVADETDDESTDQEESAESDTEDDAELDEE